jgi:hypothetical protein
MRHDSETKINLCVSLDPDVAQRLREKAEETETPLARLVNRALRSMFGMPKPPSRIQSGRPRGNGNGKPAA